MRTPARDFIDGLLAPWHGAVYLAARPRLWGWVAAPIAITIAMLGVALWLALSWTPELLRAFFPPPADDSVLGAVAGALWIGLAAVFEAAVFVVAAVVLWVVGGFVARPFYDALGARVEAEAHGVEPEPLSWPAVFADIGVGIGHSTAALLAYGAALLVLSLVALVPGLGEIAATVGGALLTSAFLARALFDLPLSRRQRSLQERLAFLWDHKAACLGLGGTSAVLLMVPGLNFVSMPVAMVGATLLYGKLDPELAS